MDYKSLSALAADIVEKKGAVDPETARAFATAAKENRLGEANLKIHDKPVTELSQLPLEWRLEMCKALGKEKRSENYEALATIYKTIKVDDDVMQRRLGWTNDFLDENIGRIEAAFKVRGYSTVSWREAVKQIESAKSLDTFCPQVFAATAAAGAKPQDEVKSGSSGARVYNFPGTPAYNEKLIRDVSEVLAETLAEARGMSKPAQVVFKKDGDGKAGTINGLRGDDPQYVITGKCTNVVANVMAAQQMIERRNFVQEFKDGKVNSSHPDYMYALVMDANEQAAIPAGVPEYSKLASSEPRVAETDAAAKPAFDWLRQNQYHMYIPGYTRPATPKHRATAFSRAGPSGRR